MQITVVIPSYHPHTDLNSVVHAVCAQTQKPFELVIVDSSQDRGVCPHSIISICENSGIQLSFRAVDHAFPGKARNIGIDEARSPWIALLDVHTLPCPDWLAQSTRQIESDGLDGVWGETIFVASSFTERLFRDGLFGMAPRQTLPGSVFHRRVAATVGTFIPWVRAGEDTDWMHRVKLMRLQVNRSLCVTADYRGLRGVGFRSMLSKWTRYYLSSKSLPHLLPQKVLAWTLAYSLLFFLSMNWNNVVANWQVESPWYIPNVTKITATIPLVFYAVMRGLVIPVRRGVPVQQLLPFRFALIALGCGILDAVKVVIFSFTYRNHKD